ncbi:DUF2726 domain-containing protein [Thermosyntropha sp.]|uniref:DUF2726 domain-containing protein n=1 Tax=Thermosyntropha sp. TaxID=2740820 RepID=UPI0025E10B44|nr:DUF2726 domain-containing protein [Thermosyntropha sp.]MBO8159569.1 DUF2726 domain-containing protein [Thermosyntropha sp.]
MGQFILAVIGFILLKLLWDIYKEKISEPRKNKPQKGGKVIDVSEAWIDINNLPYTKKTSILSAAEKDVYNLLNKTLPADNFKIFPKVRLSDFMQVDPHVQNSPEYVKRINSKSVDFLICHFESLEPLFIVQVHEGSNAKKEQIAENFLEKAAKTAGIPVLTLNFPHLPSTQGLIRKIKEYDINI